MLKNFTLTNLEKTTSNMFVTMNSALDWTLIIKSCRSDIHRQMAGLAMVERFIVHLTEH